MLKNKVVLGPVLGAAEKSKVILRAAKDHSLRFFSAGGRIRLWRSPKIFGALHNVLSGVLVLMCLTLAAPLLCAQEAAYDAGSRRDPFVALKAEGGVPSSAASTGFRLEGIIYDPGLKSMAILSGKTYQVGEALGEATVLRIAKDHVVISVAGEEKTLWIREEAKS